MNENVFDLHWHKISWLEDQIAELRTLHAAEVDQLKREKEKLLEKIAELQFELDDIYDRMTPEEATK